MRVRKHQGVAEDPDHLLQLAPIPVGDRRSDDDVLQPGDLREQHVEGRQQRHVQRHALLLAERDERLGQARRQLEEATRPSGIAGGGAGPIRGQRQPRGKIGELLLPVGDLLLQLRAPVDLPGGEIGVLDRKLRQCRRSPFGEGGV